MKDKRDEEFDAEEYVISRSTVILSGLQVKSIEKAKKLAYALNIIEEECGIKEVDFVMKDMFICPWINLDDLKDTEMELLVRDIFIQLKNQDQ